MFCIIESFCETLSLSVPNVNVNKCIESKLKNVLKNNLLRVIISYKKNIYKFIYSEIFVSFWKKLPLINGFVLLVIFSG